jgi:uncharacterized protein (DUF58 family)
VFAFDGGLRIAETNLTTPRQFPGLCEALAAVQPTEVEPSYDVLRRALMHVRRKGAPLVVVSALSGKAIREELDGDLGALARRFRISLVRVEDPGFRVGSACEFVRPEEFYRSAYLRMAAAQDHVAAEGLAAQGGDLLTTVPQELLRDLRNLPALA